ncbi:MAG: sulfatase [Planctomycetota bacterium]
MVSPRAGAVALLLACAGCGAPAPDADAGPQRVVVLFLVDTLRADRLSTYGHTRETSPNLDRLAATGVVFEQAWSPAPWTLPATASLLTGLDPTAHGAGFSGEWRDLDASLPNGLAEGVVTLPERLSDAGWRCEAMVTNPFVGFGLERGFERFELAQTEGADVVRFGLERLDVADERPLFLLLHLMDAHDPLLVPDEDVLTIADGQGQVPLWSRTFEFIEERVEHRDERLRTYDGAVRYVDRQLGVLLDGLEARGMLARTTVAFTSDHGEELFETSALQTTARYRRPERTRALGHGHVLFEEVQRVPLVIGGAGLEARAGQRRRDLVASHDLAPTLLDLADVAHDPSDLDARSLAPWIAGGEAAPRAVVATGIAYGPDRWGLVRDGFEFVQGGEGEEDVLVEVGGDERRDLSREQPQLAAELRSDLEAARQLAKVRTGSQLELSDAERERLQAIGYLAGDEH